MHDKVWHVLFLCTNNVVRSIMAEALLQRLGQGVFQAYSAGSHPTGVVHPYALELLAQHQYPTAHLQSKSWTCFTGPQAPQCDFVFTLSEEVARAHPPVWSGDPLTVHWGIPAPIAVEGNEGVRRAAFAQAMQRLEQRITHFITLPFATLDRATVHQRLMAIGAGSDPEG
jgi:protein-tyrosine-phosphatase